MKTFVVVVGLVALLGGVGSGRAEPNDRCTLLTQAEAMSALGAPVRPGESAIAGCQWGQLGGDGFVQVEVADAKSYQRPPKTAKMISGLGIEAYSNVDFSGPLVMAKTNKSMVVVWASGDHVRPERLIDLARMVIDRVERP